MKLIVEKWKRGLKNMGWDGRLLISVGLLSMIPIIGQIFMQDSNAAPAAESRPSVDTLIPRGFVLVPIEVQNYEALDSILGRFGVVDLFQNGNGEASNQHLVARNVRILRAPQNPSHFAILVREEEVSRILQQGGQFTVIVKRQQSDGTEFVNTQKPKRRKIVYEGG